MPTIITTLLSAAAFLKKPVQDVAAESLKDAYGAAKAYLVKKLGANTDAARILELVTGHPESAAKYACLFEDAILAGLESDAELRRLIDQLAALMPAGGQNVHVGGERNHVQVAGRDLITTTKHFRRNLITPDERHLSAEERERVRRVITEIGARFASEDGKPNYAAVHRMIQSRYQVASYLLVPREKFADLLQFLKTQRAMRRARLRRRNPTAYRNDFFHAIYAGADELGWDRPKVWQFAFEKLGLKKPLTSLKELGPNQLKSLAELVQRQIAKARQSGQVA